MQAQYRGPAHNRVSSHNGAKRQILGNPAAKVAPAWKVNTPSKDKQKAQEEEGSKILLSRLPEDVGDNEVEDLFKKTVGPVKQAFIIYNSRGQSKGMAVVAFQRSGDAAIAKVKYDGKFVDQKKPIKIEIITDGVPEAKKPSPPTAPSLLSRLGGLAAINKPTPKLPTQPRGALGSHSLNPAPPARQRIRTRKGPRRVNKKSAPQLPVAIQTQLDREIEEYQAASQTVHVKTHSAN